MSSKKTVKLVKKLCQNPRLKLIHQRLTDNCSRPSLDPIGPLNLKPDTIAPNLVYSKKSTQLFETINSRNLKVRPKGVYGLLSDGISSKINRYSTSS